MNPNHRCPVHGFFALNSQRLLRCSIIAAMLVAGAVSASAQEHPNVARGRSGSSGLGIDTINPFNGNLTLSVPLGPTYPVGPELSFQLSLFYNSQVWENESAAGESDPTPVRTDNAGLGWRLSLGQLMPPGWSQVVDPSRWIYIAPDGSRHTFFDTLHDGETPTTGFGYTRDGSYLRLNSSARTVELPNGIKHTFDAQGNLTDMADPFGNWVHVSYAGNPVTWTITDVHGRTHLVVFKNTGVSPQQSVVDHVELARVGGGRSTLTFRYSADGGSPTSQQACGGFTPLTVTFLTAVELPDLTRYAMPLSDYYVEPPPTDATQPCRAGRLARLTLPTLGKIEWDYALYKFPVSSTNRLSWQRSTGVARRSLLNPDGTANGGSWTYTTSLNGANTELVNTVTAPSGTAVRTYFSVCSRLSINSICAAEDQLYEYGLPLSRERPGDGAGRFLSSEVVSGTTVLRSTYVRYDHDAFVSTPSTNDRTRLNQRPAANRVVFNDDGGTYADETLANFDGHGHYRSRVLGGSFPGNNSRTEATGWAAGNGYSPGQPGYQPWPTGSPWILGVFSFTWSKEGSAPLRYRSYCFNANGSLLGRRVHGSSDNTANYTSADLIEVFLLSPQGFVTDEYYLGGDVQPVNADPIGGFICGLAQTPSFYQGAQYRIHHQYAYGNRTSSAYYNAAGSAVQQILQQTIDPSTGFPTQSADRSGLSSSLSYDGAWRLSTVQPTADASTVVSYTNAAVNGLGQLVNGSRVKSDRLQGGTSLLQSQLEVDAWGRPVSEKRTIGNNQQVSETRILYDAQQRRSYVSVPGKPGSGTSIKAFDAFDRPTQIRPPDGNPHDVFIAYSGVRTVSRTVKVATVPAEGSVTTTETYDRFGRLYEVLEPNGVRTRYEYDVDGTLTRVCQNVNVTSGLCGQERRFNYDTRGLLLSETHPETSVATTYGSFDARGHATQRANGASSLAFSFDRAERLTLVKEGAGQQRPLKTFSYASSNGNFTDPLTGQSCFEFKQGKIGQQSRFNYGNVFGSPFTVELRESFTYCGREGRMSRRSLDNYVNYATTPSESFVLPNVTYDGIGEVTSLDYPRCTHAACTAPSPRTASFTYSWGFLNAVGIPGQSGYYASSITYHPSLMVNQVVHNNGLTDTYALDPNSMPRPASIKVQNGATTRWDTGSYAYDGAGNVKAIGTHNFTYDALSRLTAATLYLEPTSSVTQRTQSYNYDVYGNIQSFAGSSGLTTMTSSATNRLTNAAYDSAGNMTGWNNNNYSYDPFNLVWDYKTLSDEWVYLYTADDERAWTYKTDNTSLWTLRGIDGKVLREYSNNGTWTLASDYIYRNGLLLAAETPQGIRHFHLDHLGTPRLITDSFGQQQAYHVYYPYGEEATVFNQDTLREKFTGHERDLGNLAGPGDDLDYMHARHYNPPLGRFVSTDPLEKSHAQRPQGWNRYSYVDGNPINFVDPTGMYGETITVTTSPWLLWGADALIAERFAWDLLLDFATTNYSLGRDMVEHFVPSPLPGGGLLYVEPCIPVSMGATLSISTINPWSSGGGVYYGINLERVGNDGIGLYYFNTPNESQPAGLSVGVSATSNIGFGEGAWTGDFFEAVGSYLYGSFGGFSSPASGDSLGWHGGDAGLGVGPLPIGLGAATTRYYEIAKLPFRSCHR
jgi:RHS repeat-associated protein